MGYPGGQGQRVYELGAQARRLDIIICVWYLKVHKISQGEHVQQKRQWAESGPSRNANN